MYIPMALLILAILYLVIVGFIIFSGHQRDKAWRAKVKRDIAKDKELIRHIKEKL